VLASEVAMTHNSARTMLYLRPIHIRQLRAVDNYISVSWKLNLVGNFSFL